MVAENTNGKPLSLEKAIQTAIEFETKVRNVYRDAMAESNDQVGKRIFRVLAREEQGHLNYLNERLAELKKDGVIAVEEIETEIPSREEIQNKVKDLKGKLESKITDTELKHLGKAVEVELETSAFYKQMVKEMDGDGQKMFKAFMEIEEGHVAIVQAELDAASGMGFFFGFEEFNLEAE